MGRTEPTFVRQPAAFRRDVRSKQAKATLNKVIPLMLSAHPRARRGIASSELIVSPPAQSRQADSPNGKSNTKIPQPDEAPGPPRLTIQVTDTLTAARSLLSNTANSVNKVAILNMASPLSPGGGFLNGATSQEEFLCMRTTILPSLKDDFYRLPEVGCVYTPDVLVFRSSADGEDTLLSKNDRWFVDVVSAGMLRSPDTEVDQETGQGEFVQPKDRELAIEKMRAVMRVLRAKGAVRVVLGAWGCGGAYCNPLGEIARAWRRVLVGPKKKKSSKRGSSSGQTEESWHGLEEVTFAIKDQNMADAFRSAFGDELEWVHEADDASEDQSGDGSEADVKHEDDAVDELSGKISQLKIRIHRTSDLRLKRGLEAVLEGLQSQLPAEGHMAVMHAEGAEEDDDYDGGDGTIESHDEESEGDCSCGAGEEDGEGEECEDEGANGEEDSEDSD